MAMVELSTGIRMYYEMVGEGEPVVLLFGSGGDHSAWGDLPADLGRHFRVITPDSRGTGQTDAPLDALWTMRTFADDTIALLDALGIERAHFAGLSLGSAVSQEIGINYPERVRSLSLYNTWGRTDSFLRFIFEHGLYLMDLNDPEELWRYYRSILFSPHAHEHRPELIELFRATYMRNPHATPARAMRRHAEANLAHDAFEQLGSISAPTLVLAGEEDMQFLPRYPREVAARIPGAQFRMLTGDGSSHLMFLERPLEFRAMALEFLLSARRRSAVGS